MHTDPVQLMMKITLQNKEANREQTGKILEALQEVQVQALIKRVDNNSRRVSNKSGGGQRNSGSRKK